MTRNFRTRIEKRTMTRGSTTSGRRCTRRLRRIEISSSIERKSMSRNVEVIIKGKEK